MTGSRLRLWRALLATLLAILGGAASAETLIGRVVGVSDGDTVTVLLQKGHQVKVRLSGIDAPEKRQPFGQRAKERLSALVFDKYVTIVGTKTDRYRRLIAKVLVNKQDANLEMVSSGLAWHYKKYELEQPREDRLTYARAEMVARSEGRGLWADYSPIPPWQYRHR